MHVHGHRFESVLSSSTFDEASNGGGGVPVPQLLDITSIINRLFSKHGLQAHCTIERKHYKPEQGM